LRRRPGLQRSGDGRPRARASHRRQQPADIDEARKAGAAAYLTKDRIADELIPAIHDLGSH
jgi:DNA-binding NarL/FixJ family response regulator